MGLTVRSSCVLPAKPQLGRWFALLGGMVSETFGTGSRAAGTGRMVKIGGGGNGSSEGFRRLEHGERGYCCCWRSWGVLKMFFGDRLVCSWGEKLATLGVAKGFPRPLRSEPLGVEGLCLSSRSHSMWMSDACRTLDGGVCWVVSELCWSLGDFLFFDVWLPSVRGVDGRGSEAMTSTVLPESVCLVGMGKWAACVLSRTQVLCGGVAAERYAVFIGWVLRGCSIVLEC